MLMLFILFGDLQLVVEPSGAASLAAAMSPQFRENAKWQAANRIAVVLSGGNVDFSSKNFWKLWAWEESFLFNSSALSKLEWTSLHLVHYQEWVRIKSEWTYLGFAKEPTLSDPVQKNDAVTLTNSVYRFTNYCISTTVPNIVWCACNMLTWDLGTLCQGIRRAA